MCNRMGTTAQEVVQEKFVKQFGRGALDDPEQRRQFGHEWCQGKEFKFTFRGAEESGISSIILWSLD